MRKENGVFTGNMNEFFKKGQEIFYKINPKLEKQHHGKVLLIEVESEDYFVDEDSREAMRKAKAKYPDRLFFRCRVGVGPYQILRGVPYSVSPSYRYRRGGMKPYQKLQGQAEMRIEQ